PWDGLVALCGLVTRGWRLSVARRGGTRDEVEWGTEWDGRLAFDTVLEFGHESGEVEEDPGVHVGVFDGFAFLGVDEQVGDAGVGIRRGGVEEVALFDEAHFEV